MKELTKIIIVLLVLFFMNACATFKPQYKDADKLQPFPKEKEIAHSFYLIGDAGNSQLGTQSETLKAFKIELGKASKNSTAIFLGDNIYPAGFPNKNHKDRAFAEHQMEVQTNAVKGFKGNPIFIPGNHDWYSNGLKGLKRQEKFVEEALGKNTFLPENGCPIKKIKISDEIVMIIVDSEWYLTNWNKHPNINDDCEIKTRTAFFAEFESFIKKARGKTTIVALHHPMFTNGSHGGQYSFMSHMKPLPILGTLKNVIRKTGGVTTVDTQNKLYNEFRKRIITLSQENDKTIFISGHDHNLQYLVQDNLPQIISGSGSKINPVRNIGNGKFSYATQGYARLDVFKDGSSYVRFYSVEDDKVVFESQVLSEKPLMATVNFNDNISKTSTASIYSEEETTKSKSYKKLWGKRYREDFSTKVKAPNVNLDTLFGGLKPVRKGGGHQSKSLRLKDKQGREYVMRALRKSAVQYLQAVAFKEQYIKGQFEDTYTEGLLLDVFTGAHPYAPFTIATLSDAIGVYHTNPVLYFVPKQEVLGQYNDEFGDELYMIEERASSGHGDKAGFGFSDKLISTNDMLKNLLKDENHVLDEASYIRARLFDMLIGDWDRHEDQWRWATFKENDKTIYRPVPRDRDQAFSIMADGTLLGFATKIVPSLRLMKSYDEELKSPKWFNLEPYSLDMALINQSDKTVWDAQVNHIVTNLTKDVIDDAFSNFPSEVNQETIKEIKQKLIGRRGNLKQISDVYYKYINKFAAVKGTNKDDWFDVERLPDGKTKVTGYRIKKGEKGNVFYKRIFTYNDTKEIWIYGLDDKDVFYVFGNGKCVTKIRLIGGQNNDTYTIENGKRVIIYDHKTKKSTFETSNGHKKLTDNYQTNVYDYKKLKGDSNQLIPILGSNPDDGFKIGFTNTYTAYGFERNPFTSQHTFSASYYFATSGFDLAYKGEIANVIGSFNFLFDANFTSSNYAINFFGFGSETPNPEADDNDGLDVGLDFNRVKLRQIIFKPWLVRRGRLGSSFKIGLSYETIEIEDTAERFINSIIGDNIELSDDFLGVETVYSFANKDNEAFPTLGMEFSINTGYKINIDTSNGFGYLISELGFDYKLIPSGQLVLATKARAHFNLGDDFEFYQAATIGASNGLRGYRNERFTGKRAFIQSTDLRLNLRKVKTGILPLNVGFYGGIDYGRVWLENDNSRVWNTSIGGGIFANMADMMTLNLSAFHAKDGLRLAFKFGFGF